jgi:hypothetical protein
MNDAYKHLRKKGLSYKEKKEMVKGLESMRMVSTPIFDISSTSALTTTANLNDDTDLSILNSIGGQLLAVAILSHHLKSNEKELINFLDELEKEENLKK